MGGIERSHLHHLLLGVTKPTRYTGGEVNSITKDWEEVSLKVGLVFPDSYEVGMSHLGLKILYHLLNGQQDILAERIYAPWMDMEEVMRRERIPLFSLESRRWVKDFSILGFTLQYELSYSNILNILSLSQIPLYSEERGNGFPLVMAGGPNAFNPEPLAPFMDLFVMGEGEEVILEIMDVFQIWRKEGGEKESLLQELGRIEGIYVPSLFPVKEGRMPHLPTNVRIKKRVMKDLDKTFYPSRFIVPYMDIIHDRIILEIARGCNRGCRFCQAGILYRPIRERSLENCKELALSLLESTGYGEISLASLSTSDYSHIKALTTSLMDELSPLGVGISLPSLRLDSFSVSLAHQVQRVRKTGLTFAPEAGSHRLRTVINKGIDEEDLLKSAQSAFRLGWKSLKLYFLLGLPTEEEEDLEAIVQLVKQVYSLGRKTARGGIKITVSLSNFVPKPHTPFQWVSFLSLEQLNQRIQYLKNRFSALKGRIVLHWHDPGMSLLEAALSRGDRRLAPVLHHAHQAGARFDSWTDHFQLSRYEKAFHSQGLDMEAFACRDIPLTASLPWDHINTGVNKTFLQKELERALGGETTPNCRDHQCQGCGIKKNLHLLFCGDDRL